MEWPRPVYALCARFRSILSRRRLEQDLEDELSFHLAMQARANVADGMSETESTGRAQQERVGIVEAKEACRDVRPLAWVQDVGRDVLYAQRSLRRAPGFAVAAISL